MNAVPLHFMTHQAAAPDTAHAAAVEVFGAVPVGPWLLGIGILAVLLLVSDSFTAPDRTGRSGGTYGPGGF